MNLLDEYSFALASRSVEVSQGVSGGEMVAMEVLTVRLSEDSSRVNKVDITSRCPPHSKSD